MRYKALYKKMHSFAPKFVGDKTMGQVMYWARKIFKNENAQINRLIDRDNIALSAYTVGGFFHQMKQYGESDIELYIVFNEKDKDMLFPICQNGAKLIIDELFKTYVHEKRHRYQFRKRGKASARRYKCPISDLKLKEEMEYYGDSDELDAYAQEAVIEMRTMGYSNAMEKYKELFDKHDKKVYNRFLKKYYKFEDKISL